MNDNIITLTGPQFADLRGKGQAYSDVVPGLVRLIRESSGYGPLPGATNQVVLTDGHLDTVASSPDGVEVEDTAGDVTWQIRLEGAQR